MLQMLLCLEWSCTKSNILFLPFSYLKRNLCRSCLPLKKKVHLGVWKMDLSKGKYSSLSSLYKTNLLFQGKRGIERNILLSKVILYLSHWERFCFNETDPKQVKRIGCNITVLKLETSPHLGMWEIKLVLLENENWYMKLGIPCLWGTDIAQSPKPRPSHLVQKQQPQAGKTSLLPHSPVLLGTSHPQFIMRRNNF